MFDAADFFVAGALGLGAFLLYLAPIIVALGVSFWPGNKPRRKVLFSFVSGIMVYGLSMLTLVLFVPFEMVAIFLAPSWADAGHTEIAGFFSAAASAGEYVAIGVGGAAMFVVPIYLRRKVWLKLTTGAA